MAALAAAAFGLGLLGLLGSRALRGKGDLAVTIELSPDRRGTFSVRLARRKPRRRAAGEEAVALAARASSRFEHNMVSRDTQFHGLPARTWWVVVEGMVEGTGADRARSVVFEDREVKVEGGRAVRVEFDLRPRECPVEVRVVQGGGPAARARVALAGDLTSLRYARDGLARFGLPPGTHRILVGGLDRVAERELRIENLAPKTLVVDLGDGVDLVFGDCETAVEPYLRGDLSVAANALERAGQPALAHLLRARFHRTHGELERAAGQYEAAGRPLEAAEAWAEAASFERAAALFERGGEAARAAEMYEAAGDLLRAGRAFEEAGDLESAARCYREANAVPKLIDVLEKRGESFEAGRLSLERGDVSRAIRNYQQVDARHERYTEVCRFLAEKFSEQGKLDLAAQKADEAVSLSDPAEASPDTLLWYGDLLERAGKVDRALRAFEELQRRAPERSGVDERVEALRKRLSSERRASPRVAGASDRYEILAEIGRGGMGVVYQARDRRLGRDVALKRLPENLKDHPRAVELFLREARSAAALNHPNIVTVHDVDQDETGFFLTMELLEGQTLAEIVRSRGRVTPLDTARLGIQAAHGPPVRPRAPHRPPRREDGEPVLHQGPRGEDHGLRPREDARGGAQGLDDHRRHALLHGAGAGDGRGRRPPRRPLRLRRDALRAAHRARALRRRRRHLPSPPHAARRIRAPASPAFPMPSPSWCSRRWRRRPAPGPRARPRSAARLQRLVEELTAER